MREVEVSAQIEEEGTEGSRRRARRAGKPTREVLFNGLVERKDGGSGERDKYEKTRPGTKKLRKQRVPEIPNP